ncbi:MAG TPA: drug/metabolite exporter YedA [Rudaea sp.]|nr:drug/metabolite exporter YedA [Rudaea sp.]HSC11693.1 drug/metabolite exporter YedA [Rhodanobacteraceae bacterium]
MNAITSDTTPAAPLGLLTPRVLVPLALIGVYLIWGSTYLAIRIALADYPPFLMGAIRFFLAGALMFVALRWRGIAAPTRAQWANCAVTGTLLLGFGNGLVCYAEQTVASGLSAVAVASMPLFAALCAAFYRQLPTRMESLGLLVGFGGVVLLNFGGDLRGSPLGALALIVAAATWAFGSVWSRRRDMPHPAMSTAAQMLCGSVALGLVALLTQERVVAMHLDTTLALAYLLVFGSILGFSAYIYLLHHVRPALATSYAYVNPPVAVLIGVMFGGESVRLLDLVGMAVILTGVAAITLAKAKKSRG